MKKLDLLENVQELNQTEMMNIAGGYSWGQFIKHASEFVALMGAFFKVLGTGLALYNNPAATPQETSASV